MQVRDAPRKPTLTILRGDISNPRIQNRNREQPIPGFGFGTGGTVAALMDGVSSLLAKDHVFGCVEHHIQAIFNSFVAIYILKFGSGIMQL